MTEQTEQDVRDMLSRRAGDATTSPDAWERITERMAGGEPAHGVLEIAPRRARFSRPVVLGSMAAALLLVVASLTLLRAADDEETIRAADDPSPSPSTEPAPAPAPVPVPSPTETTVPEPTFEAAAESAADRWIGALAAGDDDVAWDLLADQSRRSVGGRSGFDGRRSELAEGWAAWAEAKDVTYRPISLMDSPEGGNKLPADIPRLGVVVITGRVTQEGTTAFRTVSLPVRGNKDRAQVDPFSDVNIELEPDPVFKGDRIPSRTLLGAFAPSGARVWFVLDDRGAAEPDDSEGADGDQQHVTFRAVPPLAPGQHSYTVVVLTVDGRAASRSTTYTVT